MDASTARGTRAFALTVAVCAAVYIASRYAHRSGLINTSFYLGALGVLLYAVATRGRALTRLLESRLALATVALLAMLAYSVQITPDPGAATAAFFKAHGHAFVIAVVVACAAAEQRFAPLLLAALLAGAVPEMVRQIVHHWSQWRTTAQWSIQYELVREYGNAYGFYLPACVAVLVAMRERAWRMAAWVIALAQTLLLLPTGFRGAWLGVGGGVLGIAVVARSWRVVAGIGVVALTGALALALAVPGNVLSQRLEKGIDSGMRKETVWRPAAAMIAAHPFSGYGYGNNALREAYRSARASHPEWGDPEWVRNAGWSAHSIYIAMWLRGGAFAFAALTWCLVEAMLVLGRTARAAPRPVDRALALAALGTLVSAYVVHGLFEEKFWPPFGIPLGIALGFAARRLDASGARAVSAGNRLAEARP
jgi:O-antigen ligase